MDDYFFNELQSHPIRPEPITDVANGLDSLCVAAQFAPDECDMLIEGAGVAVKRDAPKSVQQPIPLKHLAAPLVKKP